MPARFYLLFPPTGQVCVAFIKKNYLIFSMPKEEYLLGENIILKGNTARVPRSRHELNIPVLDADLAYLAGYHLGDGYLEDSFKTFKRSGKGGYEISYADSDIKQIELINSIIKNKFGTGLTINKRPANNVWIGRIGSCKILHWFLHKKVGLQMGKKSKICIPKWILTNENFLAMFLSGFFDAEGDVSKTTNRRYKDKMYYRVKIQLTQKEKNILLEIKDVLRKLFAINCDINKKWNQDAFTLRILSKKAVIRFRERINFRNMIKKEKLDKLISEVYL